MVCCALSVITGFFKEESTGDCVKCSDWAANQVPLIIALVFLTVGIAFYVWWKCADSSDFQHTESKQAGKAKPLALRIINMYDEAFENKTQTIRWFLSSVLTLA